MSADIIQELIIQIQVGALSYVRNLSVSHLKIRP